MGHKILYVDPVGADEALQEEFERYLSGYLAGTDFSVEVRSLGKAPMDLEYQLYLALIGPALMRAVKQAEKDGFDAVILGCFFDPFLEAAKEISERIAVVGPAEASLRLAAAFARRFSIIAPNQKVIAPMMDNVHRCGCRDALASFRSLDLRVEELSGGPEAVEERIRAEAIAAVQEDGAECLIMGCTLQIGFFQTLQDQLSLPVIDVALAALFEAVHQITVKERCGWSVSKAQSYKAPPKGQLRRWDLEEFYHLEGLF